LELYRLHIGIRIGAAEALRLCTGLLYLFLVFPAFGQNLKIGVALPLFEDSQDKSQKQLGSDILAGVKFALDEYNKIAVEKINMELRDTKKDPTITEEIMNEFGEDPDIICVLGPVFSTELAAVVDAGENFSLPIVSPTATGDELAESHDYIFQLNPSYKVRGTLMANYLMKELGLRNFAVIYEESYGSNFSKHFEKEIANLKGKLVFSRSYRKDAKNITSIINDLLQIIRDNDLFINLADLNITQVKKLEHAGIRTSLIDSLIEGKMDVSIYYLFGKDAKKILDTLNIKVRPLKKDAVKFIQGYIEALYIPISNASEIGLVLPELFSNSLTFLVAGTGDWNNEEALKDNKAYFNDLVFESEYFLEESDQRVADLKEALGKKKMRLNKSFVFGYDGMSLLLSLISAGSRTRVDMYKALNRVSSFKAIRSKISLEHGRVNSELNILSFDGSVKRAAEYGIGK
jgi:hypothetical protein